jgi:hypothetical protein
MTRVGDTVLTSDFATRYQLLAYPWLLHSRDTSVERSDGGDKSVDRSFEEGTMKKKIPAMSEGVCRSLFLLFTIFVSSAKSTEYPTSNLVSRPARRRQLCLIFNYT